VKHRDASGLPVGVEEEADAPPATPKDLASATVLYTAEGPTTAARCVMTWWYIHNTPSACIILHVASPSARSTITTSTNHPVT
jgi:hypothetical protein